MLKKMRILFITAALMIGCIPRVSAADNVEVYFNGEKKDFTVSVEQIDDAVLVPIRAIFELFNYKVEWNSMRQRITTTTAIGKLNIGIGSVLVSQNDYQAYVLSTYPRLINGTTMIPIDFASAATEASIQYAESSNSLVINAN